jgi:hypothetical protein
MDTWFIEFWLTGSHFTWSVAKQRRFQATVNEMSNVSPGCFFGSSLPPPACCRMRHQ